MLPLKGARVVGIILDTEGDGASFEEPYMALILRNDSGAEWQVCAFRDPEGNGPGFLEVAALKASGKGKPQ